MNKQTVSIVVWFSCGAASAVAAKKTLEIYGQYNDVFNIRIVNNPVIEEHEDNLRFLSDVQTWLNHPIETAINENYPSCSAFDVWEKKKYMSGITGAPCTLELKKRARQQWEDENDADYHVLGFTSEEQHRASRMAACELPELLPVLIHEQISKSDCFKIITDAGLKLPNIYDLGYPNANCIGCVKSASPTYWNLTREIFPDVFKNRCEQSRRIGCKLVRVKGKRIYLDELKTTDKGRPLKTMQIECGIFCENE